MFYYQPQHFIQPDNQGWPIPPVFTSTVAGQPNHVSAPSLCVFDGRQLYCYNQPYFEVPIFVPLPETANAMSFDPNAAASMPNPFAMVHYPMYAAAPPPPTYFMPCHPVPIEPVQPVSSAQAPAFAYDAPRNGFTPETCSIDCQCQECDRSEFRDIESDLFDNPEYPFVVFLRDLDFSLSMHSCNCENCVYEREWADETADMEYSRTMCESNCSWMSEIGELITVFFDRIFNADDVSCANDVSMLSFAFSDWTTDSTTAHSVTMDGCATDYDDGIVCNGPDEISHRLQMMTSTPVRDSICAECKQLGPPQSAMCRHIVEQLLNAHECSHSGIRVDDKTLFLQHEMQPSSLSKLHRCNGCNKSFNSYKRLVRHGVNCNYKLFISTAAN